MNRLGAHLNESHISKSAPTCALTSIDDGPESATFLALADQVLHHLPIACVCMYPDYRHTAHVCKCIAKLLPILT